MRRVFAWAVLLTSISCKQAFGGLAEGGAGGSGAAGGSGPTTSVGTAMGGCSANAPASGATHLDFETTQPNYAGLSGVGLALSGCASFDDHLAPTNPGCGDFNYVGNDNGQDVLRLIPTSETGFWDPAPSNGAPFLSHDVGAQAFAVWARLAVHGNGSASWPGQDVNLGGLALHSASDPQVWLKLELGTLNSGAHGIRFAYQALGEPPGDSMNHLEDLSPWPANLGDLGLCRTSDDRLEAYYRPDGASPWEALALTLPQPSSALGNTLQAGITGAAFFPDLAAVQVDFAELHVQTYEALCDCPSAFVSSNP